MEQVTRTAHSVPGMRRDARDFAVPDLPRLDLPCSSAAAADEPLEYQVKAAFLLNFTKFIDWPAAAFATPDSPISICILGDDPFGQTLDEIVEGEVVNGRKVIVQRIKRAPPPKSCQVLFVEQVGKGRSQNFFLAWAREF